MTTLNRLGAVTVLVVFLAACGASESKPKEAGNDVASKKAELQKLKGESAKLADQIQKLEQELATMDSTFAVKPKLVSVTAITPQNFTHYIDLQGKITTDNIYYVTPRGQG